MYTFQSTPYLLYIFYIYAANTKKEPENIFSDSFWRASNARPYSEIFD